MTTLQDAAEAMLETLDDTPGTAKKSARLKPEDRALIFRLASKGNLTQVEIAKAVGCDHSTVSRTLRLLDTRKEARTILESGAARLAETVVKTDDAAIALKTLGKLDVVRDDKESHGSQVGPVVVIGGGNVRFTGFQDGDWLDGHMLNGIGAQLGDSGLLQVRRPVGSGVNLALNLPADFDLSEIPSGVTVTEEAQQILTRLQIPSAGTVQRDHRVKVLIGTPPPGTPFNPITVGAGSTDDAA